VPAAVVDISVGACWGGGSGCLDRRSNRKSSARFTGAVSRSVGTSRVRARDDGMCGAVSVAYGFLHSLVFDAAWAELIGLVVLLASTGLAIWARLALGSMWSVGPEVGGDRSLRTRGPYGVTRHPIYTGFLGMIIGTMLLAGGHELIALAVVGLILFEVKIYQEKRLMVATFPDEYADYRRRVPQIAPGLQLLRRHNRQPTTR